MSDSIELDATKNDVESLPENGPIPQTENKILEEDVFSILEEKNNFEKLAWCIDEYLALQKAEEREEDPLYQDFQKYGDESETTLAQIKEYWRIKGSPINLLQHERFQGFLQGLSRTYFKNSELAASPQNLLEWLEFPQVTNGAEILISNIEAAPIELSNPAVSLQTMQGSGIVAFQHIEGMLEYVLSFFGRWLTIASGQDIENFIDIIKQYVPNDKAWVIDKWHDQRRVPSISQFIDIFKHWNSLLEENDQLASQFKDDFPLLKSTEIIEEDQLDELSNCNEKRRIYAHYPGAELPKMKKPKYRSETQQLCVELLSFAGYLRDNVIPRVVRISTTTIFPDDSIGINCLCEDGTIKRYDFQNLNPVSSGEYFLHLRREEAFSSNPIEEVPILFPVEFRKRK